MVRLGLSFRLILTLASVVIGVWWHNQSRLVNENAVFFGLYGDDPLSLSCVDVGKVKLDGLTLGQRVSAGQRVGTLFIDRRQELLTRQIREHRQSLSRLESARSLTFESIKGSQTERVISEAKQKASLWEAKRARASAKAKLKSLQGSLPRLRTMVSQGALAVADLERLIAEEKSLHAELSPLNHKTDTLNKATQGELKSVQTSQLALEEVEAKLEEELHLWREQLKELEREREEGTGIFSPRDAVISDLPFAVSSTPIRSCLAGETLIILQPVEQRVRLWQVTRLNHKVLRSEKLNLKALSHTRSALNSLGSVSVEGSGERLEILPPSLQRLAAERIGIMSIFSDPPTIYGIRVEGRLIEAKELSLPWGHPLVAH